MDIVQRYRKRPVVIEAIQLRWDNWSCLSDWIGEFPDGMRGVTLLPDGTHTTAFRSDGVLGMLIPTLEGTMIAREDDFIIRGIRGEYYPCKPDIFAATYEVAE